jgi:hypothetical protein
MGGGAELSGARESTAVRRGRKEREKEEKKKGKRKKEKGREREIKEIEKEIVPAEFAAATAAGRARAPVGDTQCVARTKGKKGMGRRKFPGRISKDSGLGRKRGLGMIRARRDLKIIFYV